MNNLCVSSISSADDLLLMQDLSTKLMGEIIPWSQKCQNYGGTWPTHPTGW